VAPAPEVVLARHGETEWSAALKHTGFTDIPLTATGREQAAALRAPLADRDFALVLSSPLARAVDTCRGAGLGERAELRDELREWDYGDYEGRTTAEIRERRPQWRLWRDGCPGGESFEQLAARADRVVGELRALEGDAVLFAHGHILRILTARWLGLPAQRGASFALGTATLSALGWERENPVIRRWNQQPG
jgi:broad specificity phosphatase PhoE